MMPTQRTSRPAWLAVLGVLAAGLAAAESESANAGASGRVVDRLLAEYAGIVQLSCQIRRETVSAQGRSRFLSTIYWRKDGRLHVDNIEPLPRTIVADGTNFFSYVRGDPRGFSRPIPDLDAEMAMGVRRVPGTARDHLLLIGDTPETRLPPEPDLPVRAGYATARVFAVLGLDASNRLARVELYTGPDMAVRTARYDYSRFTEVRPGIRIPQQHEAIISIGGADMRETTRVDRLNAVDPIAPNLFHAALYFPGVKFEDDFKKIYPR